MQKETTPSFKILSKEPKIQADFTIRKDCESGSKKVGARYVPAPEPNWGPKARAVGASKRAADDDGDAVVADIIDIKKQKTWMSHDKLKKLVSVSVSVSITISVKMIMIAILV